MLEDELVANALRQRGDKLPQPHSTLLIPESGLVKYYKRTNLKHEGVLAHATLTESLRGDVVIAMQQNASARVCGSKWCGVLIGVGGRQTELVPINSHWLHGR